MATKGIWISAEIMQDTNLTQTEKYIFAEIEQLSSLEDGCYAQNSHFSTLTGIAKVTVSRAISTLTDKGYISTEIENGSRNHNRMIRVNKMIRPPIQNDKTPLTKRQETKENKHINKQYNKQVCVPNPVQEWIDYRVEIKKPLKKSTINSLLKAYYRDSASFIEKVEHSIISGYQGLYAPRSNQPYKQKEPEKYSVAWQLEQEAKQREGIIDVQIEAS